MDSPGPSAPGHPRSEPVRGVAWREARPPGRILAIRLQALGDVVVSFPHLSGLHERLGRARIDFVTRQAYVDIPRSLTLFGRVYGLRGGSRPRVQSLHAVLLALALRPRGYEVVLDLQRNPASRILRTLLAPRAWAEFDRYSPIPASQRIARTIDRLGLGAVDPAPELRLRRPDLGEAVLHAAGCRPGDELVILNPAGYFVTRNWPLERYAEFALAWERTRRRPVRFLVLGVGAIAERASRLNALLEDRLIDLVGRTRPADAYAIVKRATLMVSEDSGLMHMAWTNGVPTVGLFGSSRADWAAPQGPRSCCFHSGDLDCGFCFQPTCARGDLLCLDRVTAADVVSAAQRVVDVRP